MFGRVLTKRRIKRHLKGILAIENVETVEAHIILYDNVRPDIANPVGKRGTIHGTKSVINTVDYMMENI